MKKLLSLVLAMVMLMACAAPALADEGSEPDWTEYDALVAEIKSTTDFVEREALLHKAEDMLMAAMIKTVNSASRIRLMEYRSIPFHPFLAGSPESSEDPPHRETL